MRVHALNYFIYAHLSLIVNIHNSYYNSSYVSELNDILQHELDAC